MLPERAVEISKTQAITRVRFRDGHTATIVNVARLAEDLQRRLDELGPSALHAHEQWQSAQNRQPA